MRPGRCLLASLALLAGPVSGGPIILTDDGAPVAQGELLGFDGRFYRLRGAAGEVTLDGRDLLCDGAACPAAELPLRVSGEPEIARDVIPALIETFARRNDLAMRVNRDGAKIRYELTGGTVSGAVIVQPTGTAEGFADLLADAADLAIGLRPPTGAEREMMRLAGRGDPGAPGRSAILALDALVPEAGPERFLLVGGTAFLFGVGTTICTGCICTGGAGPPLLKLFPERHVASVVLCGLRLSASFRPRSTRHAPDLVVRRGARRFGRRLRLRVGGVGIA